MLRMPQAKRSHQHGAAWAAGLAGYVEYPTQELVSGLMPLSDMGNMTTLTTKCIKPGQSVFSSINTVRDSMVSSSFSTLSELLSAFAGSC
jgi:hypothetical protein